MEDSWAASTFLRMASSRALADSWRCKSISRGVFMALFLDQFSQSFLGVVHPGFHGAKTGAGDGRDLFQRKFLDKVQQERRTLRQRQGGDQLHESLLLFL